jgi:uncharacterized protein GlcG (DUF336 family)
MNITCIIFMGNQCCDGKRKDQAGDMSEEILTNQATSLLSLRDPSAKLSDIMKKSQINRACNEILKKLLTTLMQFLRQ